MRGLIRSTCLCVLFGGLSFSVRAQDLSSHRWQDRVLLLYTSTTKAPTYRKQVRALGQDLSGVQERRLVVYTLLEDRFALGLPPSDWIDGRPEGLPERQADNGFRLVLIGLDGGVKRDSRGFVPVEDLWAQIDGMPMRRAEIRDKGQE